MNDAVTLQRNSCVVYYKMDFTDELKKLLALEYNCSESDVGGGNVHISINADNRGRRYSSDSEFFSMATLGTGCLIRADERLLPFIRDFVSREKNAHFLFTAERLAEVSHELERFGYSLGGAHHMFLPKFSVELERKFPVKCLDKLADFERFYGDERFPNALCEKFLPERPDVMALLAMDGDKIMGMAGASRDLCGSPSWLQIGIDVLPEYRGRGVGTFLVNELKKIILERGDIPFYGTAPANIYSQNIAINCGFRPAWAEVSAKKKEKTMDDDKQKAAPETSDDKTWVDDMKQELEDYIEEQGIYIRQ